MTISKLSIPTFVVVAIFFFQYIGFPILYEQWDDYRAEFVSDMQVLLLAWVGTSVSTIMLCVGTVIASKILRRRHREVAQQERLSELPNYVLRRIYLLCFVSVSALILYVNVIGFENLAITAAFNQAPQSDITMARSMMGNAFEGGYHWYSFFMRDALIFSMLALYANRSLNKNSVPVWVLVLITCCTVFSLVMATEKGLAVDFMISLFLLHVCIKNNAIIPVKGVAILGIWIVGVLSVFYILFMGDSNFYAALASIISRGFTGSMQPIYHYLEYFPQHQDWLYGSSMPNPGGIFPFSPFDLTVNVMNFVQPEHYETGVVGTMPAIYWGEIYANFGWPAVIFLPLIVGVGLYTVDFYVTGMNKTPIYLSLFVWLLMHYKNLSITSLSVFIFDFNLYLMISLYILLTLRVTKGDITASAKQSKVKRS